MLRIGTHRSEDAPFYALLLLGVLVGGGLLALVLRLWPLYGHEVMNLCLRSWDVLVAHIPTAGAVLPLLALVSILGVSTFGFLRRLRATRRFAHVLSGNRISIPETLFPLFDELDLTAHIDVVDDGDTYVFCYGVLSPRICISTGVIALLDEAELRTLLLHERYHLRRRHPLRSSVVAVIARALALIPIASELRYRYWVAQEIAADAAAIEASGDKQPLASALLKLLETDTGEHSHPWAAVGALSVTEARILHLIHETPDGRLIPPFNWRTTITPSLLIIGGLLITSYAAWMSLPHVTGLSTECMNPLFG